MNGLWRRPDFLKLWFGQTISLLGTQITLLAVPILAAVLLQATPAQMGILSALQLAPALLLGLLTNLWIDRVPRRPLMIVIDVLRALILFTIPAAGWMGFLSINLLYGLGFLLGSANFLFTVLYRAYLPALVEKEDLLEANSKLEVSSALAEIAGPGFAGWLVDWLSAPFAIVVDAVSYLVSAFSLAWIKKPEPAPAVSDDREPVGSKLTSGLRLIFCKPVLRAITFSAMTSNFAGGFYSALLVLYITRELELSALFLGVMYGVGSFSGVAATLLIKRLQKRFGVGPLFIAANLLIGVGWLSIPLLSWYFADPRPVILLGMLVAGFGNTTTNVTDTSLAQASAPFEQLGRYYATAEFIGLGGLPIGSLLGGALGTLLGVRGGLIVGGCIMLTAFLWPLFSPLRRMKSLPSGSSE